MATLFKKVVIVGAGYMGFQIGSQIAEHEVLVVLVDTNTKLVEKIQTESDSAYLSATTSLSEAVSDCDLVIESITENLRIKQNFFHSLEGMVAEDVVLVTNSSMLLPSKIARKLHKKDRFCGFHFYAPALGANLVDVSPIKQTAPAVADQLTQFAVETGFEPVRLKKENYGYIQNYLFDGVNERAFSLLLRGVATVEDIDKSFRIVTGASAGPFQMMDTVGLDVVLNIVRNKARRKPATWLVVPLLKRYVSAGKLGVKSGEGFYHYEEGYEVPHVGEKLRA